jgi:hypothetical protein
MCDYSLHAVASRPANVGEMLVTTSSHRTSTRGLAAQEEPGVAVCLLPGPALAFESDVTSKRYWLSTRRTGFRVARFCRVQPRAPEQHHDAIEFPDGSTVLVNLLSEGQRARVLQLPVIPKERGVNADAERVLRPAAEARITA